MKALQYCARWDPGLQNSIRSAPAPAPAQAPRLLQNNIPSSTERKRQQRLAAAVAREVRRGWEQVAAMGEEPPKYQVEDVLNKKKPPPQILDLNGIMWVAGPLTRIVYLDIKI